MERFRAVSSIERIGSMDYHLRIEELAAQTWRAYAFRPVASRIDSARTTGTRFLWLCIIFLSIPFHILIFLLVAIVACFRLALANADRVIFVFASSILSFYQVPRKIFYIYIVVLVVTGFLQFLRTDSLLRTFLLFMVDLITMGKANLFLRKFSGLHYSKPYTCTLLHTNTIFFPVGYIVPGYTSMEVFKFPVPPDPDFSKRRVVVGNCTITIKTLQGPTSALDQESSSVRSLRVKAPWGNNTVTFSMEDENLGRFVSYLEHVAANECKQVICTKSHYDISCRVLTIAETIEYFNRGLSLVKLELLVDHYSYNIN